MLTVSAFSRAALPEALQGEMLLKKLFGVSLAPSLSPMPDSRPSGIH